MQLSVIIPIYNAEPYLEDSETGELRDYKISCYSGVPKLMFIASNRNGNDETRFDYYDMSFSHLDINGGHENSDSVFLPPKILN